MASALQLIGRSFRSSEWSGLDVVIESGRDVSSDKAAREPWAYPVAGPSGRRCSPRRSACWCRRHPPAGRVWHEIPTERDRWAVGGRAVEAAEMPARSKDMRGGCK